MDLLRLKILSDLSRLKLILGTLKKAGFQVSDANQIKLLEMMRTLRNTGQPKLALVDGGLPE